MGMSLFYQTPKPVSARVKNAIFADAARINAGRRWWSENINFFDPLARKRKPTRPKPTPLTGDTKFSFPDGYSDGQRGYVDVEVDDDDDTFMGWRDLAFITAHLVRWSRDHGSEWQLSIEDVELGTIVNGIPTPAGLLRWNEVESAEANQRAAELDTKYASRWGD